MANHQNQRGVLGCFCLVAKKNARFATGRKKNTRSQRFCDRVATGRKKNTRFCDRVATGLRPLRPPNRPSKYLPAGYFAPAKKGGGRGIKGG